VRASRSAAVTAAITLVGGLFSAVAQTGSGCPVPAGRSSFVFRSGFWLNLHNFLHRGAKERQGINTEVPAAMTVAVEDTVAARALTAPERRAWEDALQVYVTNRLAMGKSDSIVQRLNERLAAARDDGELRDADIDPAVRQALLTAAPVYRLVWWPVHDRRNREWIASLQALFGPREACLSQSMARALAAEWPAPPIMVDASVYASWFGAYMTQHPVHITMSSNARGNQGSLGIEGLLHEAGHSLTGALDSERDGGPHGPGAAARARASDVVLHGGRDGPRPDPRPCALRREVRRVAAERGRGTLPCAVGARVATAPPGSPQLRRGD